MSSNNSNRSVSKVKKTYNLKHRRCPYSDRTIEALKEIAQRRAILIPPNVDSKTLASLITVQDHKNCFYLRWSIAELKTFINDRGIDYQKKRPRKQELIDVLEKADKSCEFPFEMLPPELRNMVYGYALTSYKPIGKPRLPALTQVSKAIKKEALPLYYYFNTFSIDICSYNSTDGPSSTPLAYVRQIDKDSVKFWESTRQDSYEQLQSLQINMLSPFEMGNRMDKIAPAVTLAFDLNKDGPGIWFEFDPDYKSDMTCPHCHAKRFDAVCALYRLYLDMVSPGGSTLEGVSLETLKNFAAKIPDNLLDLEFEGCTIPGCEFHGEDS